MTFHDTSGPPPRNPGSPPPAKPPLPPARPFSLCHENPSPAGRERLGEGLSARRDLSRAPPPLPLPKAAPHPSSPARGGGEERAAPMKTPLPLGGRGWERAPRRDGRLHPAPPPLPLPRKRPPTRPPPHAGEGKKKAAPTKTPLPLGGRGRERVPRRDGPPPGSAAASAPAQAAPHPSSPARGGGEMEGGRGRGREGGRGFPLITCAGRGKVA